MPKIEELLQIIRRADFQEIESARDQVTVSILGALAAAYPSLETWEQKAALINLIQDHLDPCFRPIMLDFLSAPDTRGDDTVPLTKAIALCHLEENFDNFTIYYNDHNLLADRVSHLLHDSPRPQEPARQTRSKAGGQAPSSNIRQSLKIIGITGILVGLALLAITFINRQTLNAYRERGVVVQARVTDKWIQDSETCLGVSYFDKNILEGSELYLTEICDFISRDIWESLRVASRINVIYLPKDPQNNTILATSLENNQLISIIIAGILLLIGVLLLAGYQIGLAQSKRSY